MKQTAVEWQFEQFFNSFEKFNNGECTFNDFLKRNLEIRKQAKEMEKEQMIEFAKLHVEAALKAVVNNVEIGDYNLNALAISKEYKNNWGGLKGIREYNAFIDGAETMIGLIASQCSTGFTPLKAEQYYNETFKQQEQ
jgi:hypothetical protein